jgi:pyridoxal phosphate enzyme (YggS family)
MHVPLENLITVSNKIKELINEKQLKTDPKIIVITKKFPSTKILPLLEHGNIHFGENKVQEAESKWPDLKKKFKNLKLHMVGRLQSNKAKKAVQLFDYIHSLDNAKLASKISQYEVELKKKVKLFISVNLGEEDQKSGILLNNLNNFYSFCTNELSLNIIGLMCLPPQEVDSREYFHILKKSADELSLKNLSMGMSSDFEQAILCGSSFLRLGTVIMGERPTIS